MCRRETSSQQTPAGELAGSVCRRPTCPGGGVWCVVEEETDGHRPTPNSSCAALSGCWPSGLPTWMAACLPLTPASQPASRSFPGMEPEPQQRSLSPSTATSRAGRRRRQSGRGARRTCTCQTDGSRELAPASGPPAPGGMADKVHLGALSGGRPPVFHRLLRSCVECFHGAPGGKASCLAAAVRCGGAVRERVGVCACPPVRNQRRALDAAGSTGFRHSSAGRPTARPLALTE